MREILFRGRRTDGIWQTGYYFAKPILDRFFILQGEEQWEVDPFTVCRYTELTDKNGVKIFENDIVKLSYVDKIDDELSTEWFAVVEFGNPNGEYNWGFQLKPISEYKGNTDILLWVDMEETGAYCEVIGNIFDNKRATN